MIPAVQRRILQFAHTLCGLKLMQQFIAASEELLPAKYSIVVNSKSCLFDLFSNVLILLSLDFLGSQLFSIRTFD